MTNTDKFVPTTHAIRIRGGAGSMLGAWKTLLTNLFRFLKPPGQSMCRSLGCGRRQKRAGCRAYAAAAAPWSICPRCGDYFSS